LRDDFVEQLPAKRNSQIQAELRELQGNVGVEMFLRDAVENGEVVLGAAACAPFVGNIFAQQIEAGCLQSVVHGSRPFDSVIQRLAGNKPPRDAPAKAISHDQRRETFALGKLQQEGTKRMEWRVRG
jgi:hypothetical protein